MSASPDKFLIISVNSTNFRPIKAPITVLIRSPILLKSADPNAEAMFFIRSPTNLLTPLAIFLTTSHKVSKALTIGELEILSPALLNVSSVPLVNCLKVCIISSILVLIFLAIFVNTSAIDEPFITSLTLLKASTKCLANSLMVLTIAPIVLLKISDDSTDSFKAFNQSPILAVTSKILLANVPVPSPRENTDLTTASIALPTIENIENNPSKVRFKFSEFLSDNLSLDVKLSSLAVKSYNCSPVIGGNIFVNASLIGVTTLCKPSKVFLND